MAQSDYISLRATLFELLCFFCCLIIRLDGDVAARFLQISEHARQAAHYKLMQSGTLLVFHPGGDGVPVELLEAR